MKKIPNNNVAICVPYFKDIKSLERLLRSIQNQSYDNYFVVVTDDGEDNEAKNLVESYGFEYFRNTRRMGPTANCNQAIKLAEEYTPQYIKVMHQDDYFTEKDSLRILVYMLDSNVNMDLAFSGTLQDDGISPYKRCISQEEHLELEKSSNYLLKGNVIGSPSSVLVRNKYIKLDENLVWLVDVDWYMKILKSQNNFVCTTKALIGIGISQKQLTNVCGRNKKLIVKEYAYIYYKYFGRNSSIELKNLINKFCWSLHNNEDELEKTYHDYEIGILRDYIRDRRPIVIFGAGKNGTNIVYQKICQMGGNIVCFCDNNSSLWGEQIIDGVICISLRDLMLYKGDVYCLVSTYKEYSKIKQQLDNANMNYCLFDMVRDVCRF